MDLEKLASSSFSDKNYVHGYLKFYQKLLHDLNPSKVLEIGVWQGASLMLWHEYWPEAVIYGVDPDPDIGGDPRFDIEQEPNINIIREDAYNDTFVESLRSKGPFDFILDDGPHTIESQRFVASKYHTLLSEKGVLAIEDVWESSHFRNFRSCLPQDLRSVSYGVDCAEDAPSTYPGGTPNLWTNHKVFVVDKRNL